MKIYTLKNYLCFVFKKKYIYNVKNVKETITNYSNDRNWPE